MGATTTTGRPTAGVHEPPVRTSLRLIWLGGLVYVVAAATHPGITGRHLAASIVTVTTGIGWAAWLAARHRKNEPASMAGIVLLALSGGVLVYLHPVGVAVSGLAGLCAASLFDLGLAVILTAPCVVAASATVVLSGGSPGLIGSAASGVAAGLVMGMGRRQGQQRVRQEADLAVARQRTELERERSEVLMERHRIAREVHDVLAHTLSALAVQMEALDSLVEDGADSGRVRDAAHRSRMLVAEGLDETRRAVRVLRDEPVDVEDQIAGLGDDELVTVRVDGAARSVSPAAGLTLVRIAQEAVTNARKHASGAPVAVLLSFDDDTTRLTVENPMTRASDLASTGAGYGLQGMRERIELAGGSLAAGPVDGIWRVHAEIPR